MKTPFIHFLLFILLLCGFCKTPGTVHGAETPKTKTSKTKTSKTKTPEFVLPIDCTLDRNCWVVKYVDVDPSPDAHKDFMCNPKTSEDHKGTDFAIRSRAELREGTDVLAAMDGTVARLRDGESDDVKSEAEFAAIKDARKECGNAVLISHNEAGIGQLSTLYCHLKKDSVKVEIGDKVTAGQKIAEVGQSGLAEFPHLHFGVVWEGGAIDPYTGHLNTEGCGRFKNNLWADDLVYDPITIFHGGFDVTPPDFDAIKEGNPTPIRLPGNGRAFLYWAGFYQVVAGDIIEMKILDPDGREFVKRTIEIEKNRKRPGFYYTGRKLSNRPLPPGVYTGEVTYTRPGLPPETAMHNVIVE